VLSAGSCSKLIREAFVYEDDLLSSFVRQLKEQRSAIRLELPPYFERPTSLQSQLRKLTGG
jgi:hypothetical protein